MILTYHGCSGHPLWGRPHLHFTEIFGIRKYMTTACTVAYNANIASRSKNITTKNIYKNYTTNLGQCK